MIKQQLQADQISAMKSKDSKRLESLRYILAQIKNEEVDTRKEPDDNTIINIIRKEVKKLNDAIVSFERAGRTDLVEEYQAQIDIMNTYLPAQMSDEDLMREITAVMEMHKDIASSNPNQLIGICVRELKAKADPTRIAALVRKLQV